MLFLFTKRNIFFLVSHEFFFFTKKWSLLFYVLSLVMTDAEYGCGCTVLLLFVLFLLVLPSSSSSTVFVCMVIYTVRRSLLSSCCCGSKLTVKGTGRERWRNTTDNSKHFIFFFIRSLCAKVLWELLIGSNSQKFRNRWQVTNFFWRPSWTILFYFFFLKRYFLVLCGEFETNCGT